MGQEYFINDQTLENKVRKLLPSQGGAGAGFDLSASTQIIPIVDLTESAEGSNLREDLQRSISFNSATAVSVVNTTTTIVSNTGYWRLIGGYTNFGGPSPEDFEIIINDGSTDKVVFASIFVGGISPKIAAYPIDLTVFLPAGHSLKVRTEDDSQFNGSVRQIATIDGDLVNPI